MTDQDRRKGLRFEVQESSVGWDWYLVGAEGYIATSFETFDSEDEARSHISANRGRLQAAKRAKVITLDKDEDLIP